MEEAFVASEYPIILSLENHLALEQQVTSPRLPCPSMPFHAPLWPSALSRARPCPSAPPVLSHDPSLAVNALLPRQVKCARIFVDVFADVFDLLGVLRFTMVVWRSSRCEKV